MAAIWVAGSLNVDLVVGVERFPKPGETLRGTSFSTYLGGKGGNQAMALARLGGNPRVIGRVGDDQFGSRYRASLAESGADISGVQAVRDLPTGTALIEVDQTGQNRIVIVPGANGHMTREAILHDLSKAQRGDILLLQLEIPLESVWETAQAMHERGVTVVLDPAPAAEIPSEVLSYIDWITPNEHEASIITGIPTDDDDGLVAAARSLRKGGVRNVVVKAGARGAYLADTERAQPELIRGFPVQAVDTTAAGDAFNGGLAWALSHGFIGPEAVERANAVAAISVTGRGAQTAMPDAKGVQQFLAERK